MGVWGRLTSVFGRHEPNGSRLRHGVAGLAPDEPIILRWPPPPAPSREAGETADPSASEGGESSIDGGTLGEDPDAGAVAAPDQDIITPPRRAPSRQELIDELRHNYTEVIDLVRKVNTHLDEQGGRLEAQERRAERIAELMEKVPEALAALPEIREQNARLVELSGRMVEAIEGLAAATRDGQRSVEEALIEQARIGRESAERAEALLARGVEAQDRSAASLGELGQSVGASSDRLEGILRQAQASASEREAKLAAMIASGQRWLILAIVLCVSAVVVAGVAVVLLLT